MALVTLSDMRTRTRQRADMENSRFVSDSEVNGYLNKALRSLYDILVAANQDYKTIIAPFTLAAGNTQALPAGFYKLRGLDWTPDGGTNWIPVPKFQFEERGRLTTFPITRYQVSVKYRLIAATITFLPVDNAPGTYRIWYVPEMTELVADGDTFDGMNGFEEWAVLKAARKCLLKEESDVTDLDRELVEERARITEMADVRDYSQPDRVVDVNSDDYGYRSYP